MHGKGIYTWNDGRIYEGEFSDDKKHGFGIYTWADGRKYEGLWADGKQNGKGKYILCDGFVRIGIWENGKRIKWLENGEEEGHIEEKKEESTSSKNTLYSKKSIKLGENDQEDSSKELASQKGTPIV